MKIQHHIPWMTPYAFTAIEFDPDTEAVDVEAFKRFVREAVEMEAAFIEAQHPNRPPEPERDASDPGPQEAREAAPARPTPRPQNSLPSGRNGGHASGSSKRGSGLFCPDHEEIELIETIAKYQTYDTIDGVQVPAKYFCPADKNGTGENHSVWRSKALVPA